MRKIMIRKGLAVLMAALLTAGTVAVPAAAAQKQEDRWNSGFVGATVPAGFPADSDPEEGSSTGSTRDVQWDTAQGELTSNSTEAVPAEELSAGVLSSEQEAPEEGSDQSAEDSGSGKEDAAPAEDRSAEDGSGADVSVEQSASGEVTAADAAADPSSVGNVSAESASSEDASRENVTSENPDAEDSAANPAWNSTSDPASPASVNPSSDPASDVSSNASSDPAADGALDPASQEAAPGENAGLSVSADEETYPEGTIVKSPDRVGLRFSAGEGTGDAENADNDGAFAAYVNRELALSGDLLADTGSFRAQEPRRNSNYASNRLTGANRTAYGLLLEQIRRIAQGKQTSTVISLTMEQLGLDKVRWTAGDLGVSAIIKSGTITSEALEAADKKTGIDLDTLNRSLMADCPYDLYWFDVTEGVWQSAIFYEAVYNGSEWLMYPTDTIVFSFTVAEEYSANGKPGTFTVNAGIGQAVAKAGENALAIVNKYKDLSDYQKLDKYRQEIQCAVDYNYEAAAGYISYGNPWQLIWVFDGDPQTNVVCEGYSKAFQYLCDRTGFSDLVGDVISVTGTMDTVYADGSTASGDHMWNIVLLKDGRSYLCDLTNCEEGEYASGAGGALFMVGLQDGNSAQGADPTLASGSLREGYSFDLRSLPKFRVKDTYCYDSSTRSVFSDEDLTLAPGRVTEGTAAGTATTGRHNHVFVNDPYVAPTYTRTGKTAGSHCAICGQVKVAQKTIPRLVYVSSVKLNRTSAVLNKGKTLTLSATASPSNAAKKTVTWKSSNTSVARVNSKGVVTAVGKGTATITATAADGSKKKASCKITVRIPVSGVKLNKKTPYVLRGRTLALKATVSPANASDKTVTWKSSNTKVATVSAKGVIKGVGRGTATITATTRDGKKKASCKVTVTIPVSRIRFSKSTYKVSRGKKLTLKVTVTPSNAAKKGVTWTSSNPKIATVTKAGVVRGIKKGKVTITATAVDGSGVKASCTVQVR